ncbi:hypothetical protein ACFOPX_04570 [Helicobacter baculiformis]|uniref:Uncharacterized protein n=1 Tax=Helicobacter baculiformis TaxID=427351 RepID=A0ABV7ZGZ6_9HELI|nr:hypothetical protein [Helicobacter baculiformis]
MCSLKCALFVLSCNLIGVGTIAYSWDLLALLNFEASFLGFLLVLITGYQRLKNTLRNAQDRLPSKFILGVELGLGWFKVGAYALLLGTLLALMHWEIFQPAPYLLGLGACLGSVLGSYLLRNQKHS